MTAQSMILSRAADLIRDAAAALGPWAVDGRQVWNASGVEPVVANGDQQDGGAFDEDTARWIALMSPAVAPAIAGMLREAAKSAARHVPIWQDSSVDGYSGPKRTDSEVAELVEHHYGPALALARAVLGEKEESSE